MIKSERLLSIEIDETILKSGFAGIQRGSLVDIRAYIDAVRMTPNACMNALCDLDIEKTKLMKEKW